MKSGQSLGAALLAVLLAPATAGAVVFDSFFTPQTLIADTNDGLVGSQQLAPEVYGGERDFEIQLNGPLAEGLLEAAGGELRMRIFQAFATTEYFAITYDGVDGDLGVDPVGLNGLDMTEGGAHDALWITVNSNNADIDLLVYIWDGGGTGFSTFRLDVPEVTTPVPLVLRFDATPAYQVGNLDFTNVRAVQITMPNSVTDFTLRLGVIGTFSTTGPPPVPTPAVPTAGLVALAGGFLLAGWAVARSRTPRGEAGAR